MQVSTDSSSTGGMPGESFSAMPKNRLPFHPQPRPRNAGDVFVGLSDHDMPSSSRCGRLDGGWIGGRERMEAMTGRVEDVTFPLLVVQ